MGMADAGRICSLREAHNDHLINPGNLNILTINYQNILICPFKYTFVFIHILY